MAKDKINFGSGGKFFTHATLERMNTPTTLLLGGGSFFPFTFPNSRLFLETWSYSFISQDIIRINLGADNTQIRTCQNLNPIRTSR